MTDFVRVRLENGSEASVSAEYARLLRLEPLDKPGGGRAGALVSKRNAFPRITRPEPKPSPTSTSFGNDRYVRSTTNPASNTTAADESATANTEE